MTRPGFKDVKAGRVGSGLVVRGLAAALFLCAAVSAAGQPRELPTITQPTRVIAIQGQVSLPEGMPAGQVMVTLISRSGVPRHAYTTEHGRFEFEGIPEGAYMLSAKSLTDTALSVEGIEADTTRTATGSLNISLTLRKDATPPGVTKRPEVLTTVEAEQQVPKQARRAFREAIKFREENKPEKALESFSRAVELYPDYFQALAERADLLVARRKLADACKDFERALKLNPRYAPALRGAGYCKLERREFAEAANHLERAATAQPLNPNTHLLLGIAYLELDRRDEARAALIKALSFNLPQTMRAHIYLGKLFARERLYKEAADELRKYLEANPAAADAAELKAIEAQWRALAPSP